MIRAEAARRFALKTYFQGVTDQNSIHESTPKSLFCHKCSKTPSLASLIFDSLRLLN